MKWALVDNNLICQNIINYDGVSPYNADEGFTLQEINDWVSVGDEINIPQQSEPNQVSLDDLREMAIISLLAMRDSHIENGVSYNGNTFFTDQNSQNVMMQAILAEINNIAVVFPTLWLTEEGVTVNITLDDAKAIMSLFTSKKQANYSNYLNLYAQIKQSQDPSSINIDTGWI